MLPQFLLLTHFLPTLEESFARQLIYSLFSHGPILRMFFYLFIYHSKYFIYQR